MTQKTLLISRTLGIEHGKLLRPDDDFNVLKEFTQSYEGKKTAIEEMHLEYQDLITSDSSLADDLEKMPLAIFSGRKKLSRGVRGVFLCFTLPALDREKGEFTEEAGSTAWYLYDVDRNKIYEVPGEIADSIRSKPGTVRRCTMEQKTLIEIRDNINKHIKNSYLKRVDAPVGVKPILKCWMELN